MKIMLSFSFLFTILFMSTKHPLSMGSILLMQTILSSMICSLNLNSYLFSYILYLIFVGGMLILFMYMASVASNEKFYLSNVLFIMYLMMFMFFVLYKYFLHLESNSYYMIINSFDQNSNYLINKLYIMPSSMLTLMMVFYLLFTMIVVSNIIGMKFMPLRSLY
uniref:NADH-ubiquinone oxidoreductase chain 6 n=1 Tax=Okanagana oregona TaxID=2219933 RepID=A0A3Q8GB08_9HEMI|nr:NADH dehydrogenase subunit 6 [Okanagana oregona]